MTGQRGAGRRACGQPGDRAGVGRLAGGNCGQSEWQTWLVAWHVCGAVCHPTRGNGHLKVYIKISAAFQTPLPPAARRWGEAVASGRPLSRAAEAEGGLGYAAETCVFPERATAKPASFWLYF